MPKETKDKCLRGHDFFWKYFITNGNISNKHSFEVTSVAIIIVFAPYYQVT